MLTFVTATRLNQGLFLSQSLLGRSLRQMEPLGSFALQLFAENRRPLGACYNKVIELADPESILVFVHDDVSVDDWHLSRRLEDALNVFDVVGVAGNQRRLARQETWYLLPSRTVNGSRILDQFDSGFLSGSIGHGPSSKGVLSVYGPSPRAVAALDGVFLAARAGRLQESGVRFDPSLGFHLYDLDFCRTAEAAGLRIGTWPIALTHASSGDSIRSPAWAASLELYFRKWGE